MSLRRIALLLIALAAGVPGLAPGQVPPTKPTIAGTGVWPKTLHLVQAGDGVRFVDKASARRSGDVVEMTYLSIELVQRKTSMGPLGYIWERDRFDCTARTYTPGVSDIYSPARKAFLLGGESGLATAKPPAGSPAFVMLALACEGSFPGVSARTFDSIGAMLRQYQAAA